MTTTTPELAPPSKLPYRTNGGRLTHEVKFSVHQAHIHGGFLVRFKSLDRVSNLEPSTLPPGQHGPGGCRDNYQSGHPGFQMRAWVVDFPWLVNTFAMVGKFCFTGSFGLLYLYTTEVFPTSVRNATLGSCSMCARIGSILAPFLRDLGKATHSTVPNVLCTVFALTSGALTLLLPETRGLDLPDTLQQGEDLGMKCTQVVRKQVIKRSVSLFAKNSLTAAVEIVLPSQISVSSENSVEEQINENAISKEDVNKEESFQE
ncbi:Organic cation transporter protein [Araneus ventricosus]|uniref:Organic cation transporter protein n=1 Tax=Araneus ventricosus TaxID=182803 RepID=A0A4Y2MKR3_ARAVE|nr:Organic cation transporter protein [Araneus ventricosus]